MLPSKQAETNMAFPAQMRLIKSWFALPVDELAEVSKLLVKKIK